MTGVLDASMALAWQFKRTDPAEAALAEFTLRTLPSSFWIVPPVWHLEISNSLLRGERTGLFPASQSEFFLKQLEEAQIKTDHLQLQNMQAEILSLARKHRLSAYDATYLELALRTGSSLATFDRQLADAVRRAGGRVFGDPE